MHSDLALVEARLVGANTVQLGRPLRLAAYVCVPPGGSEGAARDTGALGGRPQAAAEGPAAPL